MNDKTLELIEVDCKRRVIKLDADPILHEKVETSRRAFEKGNLNTFSPDVTRLRVIYEDDSVRSKISMGPKLIDGRFSYKKLDVHQVGDDFTFPSPVISDGPARTFLIADTIVRVYKNGMIDLDPINCLPIDEQKNVIEMQQQFRQAAKIYHRCLDTYFCETRNTAHVYHEQLDQIEATIADNNERVSAERDAKASYDANREKLSETLRSCLRDIDS